LTISTLRGEDGRQVKELERLAGWLEETRPWDWICLSNALLVGLAAIAKRASGARVACVLQGEDGFLDSLPPDASRECWRLVGERGRDVDLFLAVSDYYRELMIRRADLPSERVRTALNGIDLTGYPDNPAAPQAPAIGYLARLCPAKGLDLVVDAYLELRRRGSIPDLRLHVAGTTTAADLPFVREQRERLEAAGRGGEVLIRENLTREEKIDFLRGCSVLSVPARYGEAFGLYVVEAMAAGIPVVQPARGAFPELVKSTGGGWLYDTDRPGSLADALEAALRDEPERSRRARAGQAAVRAEYSVTAMARRVTAAFEAAAAPGVARSGAL
jgi:glycosyltransferase involved in cell wall biosynthesis